ncbi:DNA repair protein RecN [Bifidobacterium pseudolongum]|uniref:DNA repair protein RecN n=1 Tax=Bifidobacterium pseudolongum TaxID=1694 RepID=UPI001F0CFA3D|nr:DNA repair protein RecN [Bifidobacterium pseudolongum]MCH4835080.1 DNA repair protein RecN [Bifidobacterium pseudolongum]
MLEELELRDLGPIHTATIAPHAGMTAITGETGAGKSMLLSALDMVCGAPADPARVAAGTTAAWAQAIFTLPADSPAVPLLDDAGISIVDNEVFLARTVPAHGRSRAVICGKTVPRSLLGAVCAELITVHGQADQLRFATAARQRAFLDRYAADGDLLHAYARAYAAYREAEDHLRRIESQEASMRQQADYLRESIARIDRIDPQAGELDELKARRTRIENAARVNAGVAQALGALDAAQNGDGMELPGACDLVQRAADALRALGFDDGLCQCADRLDAVGTELADVVFTLTRQLDGEGGPEELDALNGRIHELDELTRRWGPTLADVLAWRERSRFELEDLDDSPERLAQLCAERDALAEAALRAAKRLTKARRTAADALCQAVAGELGQLAMDGAALSIHVQPRSGNGALDAHGADDIAFLFTPFPGAEPMPMGASASGGELSRLMLALELSAAGHGASGEQGAPMTFIFDEVDAGVGGRTAVELGRRLARLARHAQVIVVTHLPQVASWAQRQYVVSKGTDGEGRTGTRVREVQGSARVEEIARMLAGDTTRTSLDHARELLDASRLDNDNTDAVAGGRAHDD